MSKNAFTGFGVCLLMILGISLFFYFNFKTVVVSGHSMEPTFRSGQRLLSSKAYWLVGELRPNDIVVIRAAKGKDYFIKRVYKMGGETVDWANVPMDYSLEDGEYVVPPDHVYVLGDNREVSEDSRTYGPVPLSRVIGKIVVR